MSVIMTSVPVHVYRNIATGTVLCPGWETTPCSGHGKCTTMREAARTNNVDYIQWDADKIIGCLCDTGFTGWDCSQKQCPLGDDPGTVGVQEVQVLRTDIDYRATVQQISLTGTDVAEVSLRV